MDQKTEKKFFLIGAVYYQMDADSELPQSLNIEKPHISFSYFFITTFFCHSWTKRFTILFFFITISNFKRLFYDKLSFITYIL